MTDGHLSGAGRYATLRVVFGALMVGPVPTLYVLSHKGPEAFQEWFATVFPPIILVLLIAWGIRSALGARARRLPASASPLHRLQEWNGMDDTPAALDPPTPRTYAAWRNSLAGRMVRRWGEPMPRSRPFISGMSFICFAIWLALAATLWTGNAAATRFWSSTGLTVWQLLVIAGAILAIIHVKQWAMNTALAVRHLMNPPS